MQISAAAGHEADEAYEWVATLSDHETQSPTGNGWSLANGTVGYGPSSWAKYRDVGLLKVQATTN